MSTTNPIFLHLMGKYKELSDIGDCWNNTRPRAGTQRGTRQESPHRLQYMRHQGYSMACARVVSMVRCGCDSK